MNSILHFRLLIYNKKNHSFPDCIISKIHIYFHQDYSKIAIRSGVRVKINILVGQGREKNQRVERTEEEKKESRWKCLHGSNNGLVKSIVSPAHRLILFVCIMYTVCTMTKQQGRGLFRFDDVIFLLFSPFPSLPTPSCSHSPCTTERTNAFAYWLESESRARARERDVDKGARKPM